jgi:nitroreductase
MQTMILEAIKARRSTRKYKAAPVTKEQTMALLEAAMLAPSACNTRPWRFIAVTKREVLDKLADAHKYAKMLKEAPLCIVVVALPKTQEDVNNGLPRGFFPQDCGAATQNILLQAEALGLGTCWCGVYPKENNVKNITEILNIPEGETPFCMIAVGEKDEFPSPRGNYDESKVAWVE